MNQNFCSLIVANTGLPDCDIKLSKPVTLFFAPKSVEITPTDANDLRAFFQDKTQLDDHGKRVIPVSGIRQVDDGYAEPTTGTLSGYGYSEQLSDGTLTSTFHFVSTLCRAKSLLGLNGYTGRAFILLDGGILLGTRLSNGNIIGLPVESVGTKFAGGIMGDGQNIKTVQLMVTFGSDKQVIRDATAIKCDLDQYAIVGLQNIILNKAGALEYQVLTECGSVSLYDDYESNLADSSLWKLTKSDGTAVNVTTVAAVPTNKSFKITATGLTPPYKINVALDSVSKLVAKGIIGFEQVTPFVDNVA